MRKNKPLFSRKWRNMFPHQSELHLLHLNTGPTLDTLLNHFSKKI